MTQSDMTSPVQRTYVSPDPSPFVSNMRCMIIIGMEMLLCVKLGELDSVKQSIWTATKQHKNPTSLSQVVVQALHLYFQRCLFVLFISDTNLAGLWL